MGKEFEITIIIFWVVQAIRQTTLWTYWWQVKEYRFDRFSLLFNDADGRKKLEVNKILIKLLFILLAFFGYLYLYFVLFLYIKTFFELVFEIKSKNIRKPVLTKRAKKILALNVLSIILVVSIYITGLRSITTLLAGEVTILVSPLLGILLTKIIVEKVKKEEIVRAKKVLSKVNPKVIGVTGSYGKTTTKEFLYHFISKKYNSARTEGSENTEFGIARKTQKNVRKKTKYFVVEMGAYKIGEINKLCNIVSPDIAVITGIEEQHLALFGSINNIKKAKFELVEALPKGGTAVFNLSNRYCRELYEKAKKLDKNLKVYGYSIVGQRKMDKNSNLYAKLESETPKETRFTIYEKGKAYKIRTKLHGKHFIENAVGAILVARLLGVSWKDIKNGSLELREPEGTMRVYEFNNNIIFIDDTRNSTPKGFSAAIDYLSKFGKYQKIIITPGLIELGDKAKEIHIELAKKINNYADKVVVTNSEPYNQMRMVIEDSEKILFMPNSNQIVEYIDRVKRKNTVILLEGRLPTKVINLIKSYKK